MNDARPERRTASGRALLVVAAVCAIAGAVFSGVAIWSSGATGEVVLEVTSVTLAEVPVTVPLLATPAADPVAVPSISDPTIELSPLAELLGVPGSAIPPAIEPRALPRSVTIGDIELWGRVRSVGLEDDGELEIPDETEIGWYRNGASPGRAGATVLAAHVTWNGSLGPFFKLGEIEPGAKIDVALEDGTQRTYEVVERTMYDKDALPRERIWRTTGDESLVLITCGGSFNPDINRYRQNVVVYAVPVDATVDDQAPN
jgi:hypothetical protein